MILRSLKIIGGALLFVYWGLLFFFAGVALGDFEPTDRPSCVRAQAIAFFDPCRRLP